MSDFDEKIIERLKRLEREVERLQVKEQPDKTGWMPIPNGFAINTDYNASIGLVDVTNKAIFSTGDKIKFTQDGSVHYAYVIAINTIYQSIQISGGSDYTFSKNAITNAYYSTATTPLGFPQWFNWTPTLNTGAADLSGYTLARFCKVGTITYIKFDVSNKSLSGSSGLIEVSLPDTPKIYSTMMLAKAYPIGGTYVFVDSQARDTGKMTIAKGTFANSWVGDETGVYISVSGFYETE